MSRIDIQFDALGQIERQTLQRRDVGQAGRCENHLDRLSARRDERMQAAPATPGKSCVGLNNSFLLMQELFSNLRRSSDAQVISTATGVLYVYEEDGHCLFTHTLLEGLRDDKAKEMGGHKTSALRDWVILRLQELSAGRQTPTARREYLETTGHWNDLKKCLTRIPRNMRKEQPQ